MLDHLHVGVDGLHRLCGRLRLGASHILGGMQDLAVQVGDVYHVKVNEAQGAHSGRGQVQAGGRAQPASPDEEDARLQELPLPLTAHIGQDDLTAVAPYLFFRETEHSHLL